tara:strand:- start:1155 stop:1694 length:540 start_codon:yes stop_codon:yes gene_type:complete
MFKDKQKKSDCLFGELTKEGEFYTMDFRLLTDLASQLKSEFFAVQLNRLLRSVDGRIDATDSTSMPPLDEFLDQIPENKIHLIRIGQRKDVNNSVVATLDCSIFFAEGLLRVTAHWCAYKGIRADEIVSTLLAPITQNNLLDRAYINWGNGEIEKVAAKRVDAKQQLFTLSGYPSVTTS